MHHSSLCLCDHVASSSFSLCVSVFTCHFPSLMDMSHMGEGATLLQCDLTLTSAGTLFPNKVTFWGSGGQDFNISFTGGHNSNRNKCQGFSTWLHFQPTSPPPTTQSQCALNSASSSPRTSTPPSNPSTQPHCRISHHPELLLLQNSKLRCSCLSPVSCPSAVPSLSLFPHNTSASVPLPSLHPPPGFTSLFTTLDPTDSHVLSSVPSTSLPSWQPMSPHLKEVWLFQPWIRTAGENQKKKKVLAYLLLVNKFSLSCVLSCAFSFPLNTFSCFPHQLPKPFPPSPVQTLSPFPFLPLEMTYFSVMWSK